MKDKIDQIVSASTAPVLASTVPPPSSSSSHLSSSSSSTSSSSPSFSHPSSSSSSSSSAHPSSSSSSFSPSLEEVEEGSVDSLLTAYARGDVIDPSAILELGPICKPLIFRPLLFKQRKRDNKGDSDFNKNDSKNNDVCGNNNNNDSNDNNNNSDEADADQNKEKIKEIDEDVTDKSEQEKEIKIQIILEKEFPVITGAIITVSDCLKFCLSDQNNGIERNLSEKNTISLTVHSQQYGNSSSFNANNDHTGTLPYALLISAGLAVISSCALLLGQAFRPYLLQVLLITLTLCVCVCVCQSLYLSVNLFQLI
jgi:hypothetical protein